VCISDEVWDRVREAWARSIPKQYRYTGKDRSRSSEISDRFLSTAIILAPPPVAVLEKWLAMVCKPHQTEAQRQEEARREALKRGPKAKEWSPRRRRAELRRLGRDTFEAAREGV
jgi:hypothetical protein